MKENGDLCAFNDLVTGGSVFSQTKNDAQSHTGLTRRDNGGPGRPHNHRQAMEKKSPGHTSLTRRDNREPGRPHNHWQAMEKKSPGHTSLTRQRRTWSTTQPSAGNGEEVSWTHEQREKQTWHFLIGTLRIKLKKYAEAENRPQQLYNVKRPKSREIKLDDSCAVRNSFKALEEYDRGLHRHCLGHTTRNLDRSMQRNLRQKREKTQSVAVNSNKY